MPINYESVKKFEKRNQARVEFTALWPDIKALLSCNFSVTAIHKYLCSEGCISMTYSSLAKYIRKKIHSEQSSPKVETQPPAIPQQYGAIKLGVRQEAIPHQPGLTDEDHKSLFGD